MLPAPIAAATAGVTACSIAVATLGASVFASPCGREQADASSAIATIHGPTLNGGRNNRSGTVRADTWGVSQSLAALAPSRVSQSDSRVAVRLASTVSEADSYNSAMARSAFREQMLRAREDAIVSSVNRLLAEKGFEAMTVDEVAADVGIAKASLYKHFTSKEELAAAAMIRVLERALAFTEKLAADENLKSIARLEAVARWTLEVQLAGEIPSLPAQNSTLRNALMANRGYLDRLFEVSDRLGAWITAAQADGEIDRQLPAEVVLYTLFARACDPVLGLLKAGGQHSDEQIVEWLLRTCFRGLVGAQA